MYQRWNRIWARHQYTRTEPCLYTSSCIRCYGRVHTLPNACDGKRLWMCAFVYRHACACLCIGEYMPVCLPCTHIILCMFGITSSNREKKGRSEKGRIQTNLIVHRIFPLVLVRGSYTPKTKWKKKSERTHARTLTMCVWERLSLYTIWEQKTSAVYALTKRFDILYFFPAAAAAAVAIAFFSSNFIPQEYRIHSIFLLLLAGWLLKAWREFHQLRK